MAFIEKARVLLCLIALGALGAASLGAAEAVPGSTLDSGPGPAGAWVLDPARGGEGLRLSLGGSIQFWYLNEGAANGKKEDYTDESGAQIASGFAINRARLRLGLDEGRLEASLQLRLEGGSLSLLDAYCSWDVLDKALALRLGQMKVPSVWELGVSDEELDFITRSRLATEIVNWSLSKSTFTTSPLYNVQTLYRDLGLAIGGSFSGFDYALMVGNGLGANYFVGADESRGFVYANPFGAYFYGARASYDILSLLRQYIGFPLSLELGGHFNRNEHPDFIYNDAKTVLDLSRWSWSADARLGIFYRLRLTGMYGAGAIEDDFDHDGKTDYSYRGWELRAVAVIVPGLFEAGARYDSYAWNLAVASGWTEVDALTLGLTLAPHKALRFQLNYKLKTTAGNLASNDSSSSIIAAAQIRL
jgi:hypothetical protein